MGAKLSQPDDAPSFSSEALLRALGVPNPGRGAIYGDEVRVIVLGMDATRAIAEPRYPFATWGATDLGASVAGVVGQWGGLRMVAGNRGTWFGWRISGGGGVTVQGFLTEGESPAWTSNGLSNLWPSTVVNGFDPQDRHAFVDAGWIDNSIGAGQPGVQVPNNVGWQARYDRIWVPPGNQLVVVNQNQTVQTNLEGVFAYVPLAAP